MILKAVVVLSGLIAVILLYAAAKPNTFHVQRMITIQAGPDKIFPLVNDLHNWPRWAPQDREDPKIKRSFSGAASGVSAVSEWSGSGETGKGMMTITASEPLTSVTIAVDWQRPFAVRNMNEFRLEPDGSSTRVKWSMTGPNLFIMKLMSVFTNMDRMMGQHFDRGLENLKAAAEN